MSVIGVSGSRVDPKDVSSNGVGGAGVGAESGADRALRSDFALTFNSIAPARQGILPEPKAPGAEASDDAPTARADYSFGVNYGTTFQPGVESFWSNSAFGFGARAGDQTKFDPNADGASGDVIDLDPSAYSETVSPGVTPEDVTRKSASDGASGGWSYAYPEVSEVELFGGMPVDAAVAIRDFTMAEAR